MVKTQSLSGNCLKLGPYKIITVQTGYVAKTLRCGVLEILQAGQHILKDANHTFNEKDGFVSIKEETKTLKPVKALTSNGVVLEIQADVKYIIDNPLVAITMVDEIENTIFEIAKLNIATVVANHSLSEFVPVTMCETAIAKQRKGEQDHDVDEESTVPRKGLSKLLLELMEEIRAQFEERGIKLLNIGITSWDYENQTLGYQVGQGAVLAQDGQ